MADELLTTGRPPRQFTHRVAGGSPKSDYAVCKAAGSDLFSYYGRVKRFPCVNLRLYSVDGPMEDSSRLIPALVRVAAVSR